jgi:hypothetical protein
VVPDCTVLSVYWASVAFVVVSESLHDSASAAVAPLQICTPVNVESLGLVQLSWTLLLDGVAVTPETGFALVVVVMVTGVAWTVPSCAISAYT